MVPPGAAVVVAAAAIGDGEEEMKKRAPTSWNSAGGSISRLLLCISKGDTGDTFSLFGAVAEDDEDDAFLNQLRNFQIIILQLTQLFL